MRRARWVAVTVVVLGLLGACGPSWWAALDEYWARQDRDFQMRYSAG